MRQCSAPDGTSHLSDTQESVVHKKSVDGRSIKIVPIAQDAVLLSLPLMVGDIDTNQ
jgi:hypothetical protein